MLTLTRKPLRQPGRTDGRTQGRYRSAALVLLRDGELLGEVLVTEAVIDPFTGSIQVRLGFNLADEVRIVRADAMERPEGPSHEWLVAREQCFDAPLTSAPLMTQAATPTDDRRNDRHADPSASGAHYVYRGAPGAADRRWGR